MEGTLRVIRSNGTISYTKIGGLIFNDYIYHKSDESSKTGQKIGKKQIPMQDIDQINCIRHKKDF